MEPAGRRWWRERRPGQVCPGQGKRCFVVFWACTWYSRSGFCSPTDEDRCIKEADRNYPVEVHLSSDPDDARAMTGPAGVAPRGNQPWSSHRRKPLRFGKRRRKRKWQRHKKPQSSMEDQSTHFLPAAIQTSPGAPRHHHCWTSCRWAVTGPHVAASTWSAVCAETKHQASTMVFMRARGARASSVGQSE